VKRIFNSAVALLVLLALSAGAFAQQASKAKPTSPSPDQIFASLFGGDAKASNPDGTLYFWDVVSEDSVLDLTKQLEAWVADKDNKDKPVRIIMNSPGGSVFAGFALMDEIANVRARGHHVKIEAYGMAASAAGFILQAADERVIGANSWVLIHQISGGTEGKYAAMMADLKFTGQLQDQFLVRLSNRSKLSLATIHDHIDNGQDWWISADDALKYGLVDSVQATPVFPANK
jgi:ATP-dependent Clp endopeptidase proteolytic subunit ClpP